VTSTSDELKSMAKALRKALQQRHGLEISHSEALELVAHQHGLRDWNTLAAQAGDEAEAAALAWTPRAARILEAAETTSRQWRHRHVGVEHLMLAMVEEGQSVPAQVLRDLGVLEATRDELRQIMASQGYYTAGVPVLDEGGNPLIDPETGLLKHEEMPPQP
jgi:ATP-dependent Clp protease ATP-binding subunit ClpA